MEIILAELDKTMTIALGTPVSTGDYYHGGETLVSCPQSPLPLHTCNCLANVLPLTFIYALFMVIISLLANNYTRNDTLYFL